MTEDREQMTEVRRRMTLALDSKIFGPLFNDPEIAGLFDDEAFLRAMLKVEGALALVEAHLNLVPTSAGEQIADICNNIVLFDYFWRIFFC